MSVQRAGEIEIRLPDGKVLRVERGSTPGAIAAMIGPGLAKAALAAQIDGRTVGLMEPLDEGGEIRILTAKDADSLPVLRHSAAHILATAVDHETGEILSEEALAALNALDMERDALVLDLAAYMKGEEAEADAIREQAKRLMDRAGRHQRRAAWLADVIGRNVEPGRKLSDARSVIGWRKSTAVKITDADAIPDELYRYERALDRAEIARRLKAGEKVEGAELEVRMNLQVK